MTNSNSLPSRLWKPVDNTPLVLFRILLGFLLFFQSINDIFSGRVRTLFIEPAFTFPFIGFEWLQPLPGNGMYVYFLVMGLLAIMVMLGAFYRVAIVGYTLLWTSTYLMQKCGYNNHYYLIVLICAFMCIMPAHRRLSVDVWLRPRIRSNYCPQWCSWLFIAQFGIVYTYAAIAKLYPDWLSGRYLESTLTSNRIRYFLCYIGIIFDFLVTPLMLFRHTRTYGMIAAGIFHLTNAIVFTIGIFPFLALSAMLFFYPPNVIRQLLHWPSLSSSITTPPVKKWKKLAVYAMGIYLLIQVLLPVRYLLFGTQPYWSEEGFRMSWRMMSRNKSGWVYFRVVNNDTRESWIDEPEARLNYASLNSLAGFPDIIWQYAQHIKEICAKEGMHHISVYAVSSVSLNGRHPQPLVDPKTDLANTPWEPYRHANWIVPLEHE
ncbi:HTTM domain-containing protein [Chitinophaga sp.]|uniref:HTTM domain-containing protein n=1 Tax=Chitinophaga sp. TaxID=1869181 RepID=UPI0031D40289